MVLLFYYLQGKNTLRYILCTYRYPETWWGQKFKQITLYCLMTHFIALTINLKTLVLSNFSKHGEWNLQLI